MYRISIDFSNISSRSCFALSRPPCCLSLMLCRTKTNMASSADVHVRICGQEIIKYDLEIKALIQVRNEEHGLSVDPLID